MNRPFGTYALVGVGMVIVGVLENVFFGADSGGLEHQVSVAFFFLMVLGLVLALVAGGLALVARLRRTPA